MIRWPFQNVILPTVKAYVISPHSIRACPADKFKSAEIDSISPGSSEYYEPMATSASTTEKISQYCHPLFIVKVAQNCTESEYSLSEVT